VSAGKSRRNIRLVLGAAGVAVLGYGLVGLPTELGPAQLLGLLTWMAVAVLLHDGVLVPLSTAAGFGLTRAGSRLQPASAAVLRGALLTGSLVTLLTALLLKAQSVARKSTVLEADYAVNLACLWAVLAVVSAVAILLLQRRGRRAGSRRR